MPALTLACGPSFEDLVPFLLLGAAGLIVGKLLLYVWFVQAFRYRVAAPIPMTRKQAWKIASIRAGAGAVVVGATWLTFFCSRVSDEDAVPLVWCIASAERLAMWWILGHVRAKLRGRRLLGWTLSGVAIDATSDAGIFFVGKFGLGAPVLGFGIILVFITVLYLFGRRTELLNRFASLPICNGCSYNLTGNLSGICPECGTPIVIASPSAAG